MEPREALRPSQGHDSTPYRRAGAAVLACLTIAATGCTAGFRCTRPHLARQAGAAGGHQGLADRLPQLCRRARGAARCGGGERHSLRHADSGGGFAPHRGHLRGLRRRDGTRSRSGRRRGTAGGAASSSAAGPAYSGTNDYTAGVDEPDLVKTDGRRIVTVSGSTLQVIDAATRQVKGTLDLSSSGIQYGQLNLLLSGDHVLVISTSASEAGPPSPTLPKYGPKFILVDLAGQPRVLASYAISGNLVDARLTGSIVRVVTDSAPHIVFPTCPAAPATPSARQRTGSPPPGRPGRMAAAVPVGQCERLDIGKCPVHVRHQAREVLGGEPAHGADVRPVRRHARNW